MNPIYPDQNFGGNYNRTAEQESMRLMSARFPVIMTFLELSQPDVSDHRLENDDCRKATRSPEGINRIDSGKLKLCAPLKLKWVNLT